MSEMFVNPAPFLEDLAGRNVVAKLKWGWELRGLLKSSDPYMNIQLADAEEWQAGECRGVLGEVLVRCNNILYVREVDPAPDKADC